MVNIMGKSVVTNDQKHDKRKVLIEVADVSNGQNVREYEYYEKKGLQA